MIIKSFNNDNFPIIVFDIGGTWFRSGLYTAKNKLISVDKIKAINYKNTSYKIITQLQNLLVDYLIAQTEKIQQNNSHLSIKVAAISIGAALNAHNGFILNSGPLWGSKCQPFNLMSSLNKKKPSIKWHIVNDISASLLRNIQQNSHKHNLKTTLITISTGIGARTYDFTSKSIPVDPKYGVQGEIGHIPIKFSFRNHQINLNCDCGGKNHLNAFCSGRGIESVLSKITNKKFNFYRFLNLVKSGDDFANEILNAVTKPLAELIINLFTFDPLISQIILTGGVVHSLGKKYLESLLNNLNKIGMYQITSDDKNYFRKKISLGVKDDNSGMIGAALYAKLNCAFINKDVQLSTTQPIIYKVYSINDLFNLKQPPKLFKLNNGYYQSSRRIIFIDKNVDKFYGTKIRKYLKFHQIRAIIIPIQVSESRKNKQLLLKIIDNLIKFKITRRSEPIIVIGGGVIMDTVGLAASLYKRGIPYIKVPTTLLGIVDAGIGVKTAINYNGRKSHIGSYYAPLAIFSDLNFLDTLPIRHIRNGLAEILKIALVKDKKLFKLLQRYSDKLIKSKFQLKKVSKEVVNRSIIGMLKELEPNLWEKQLERKVDYGHTFSPIIEMNAKPKLLHGEAVAVDMAIALTIAYQRKYLKESELDQILNLFLKMKLPIYNPVCTNSLLKKSL
ncbi:MAG: ROK family protein [Patescibacteria group bacterium]